MVRSSASRPAVRAGYREQGGAVRTASETHGTGLALDRVARAPSILSAMRATPALLAAVEVHVAHGHASGPLVDLLTHTIDDRHDTVLGISAVHALGRVSGPEAAASLAGLLWTGGAMAAHVAWAIRGRTASAVLVDGLADTVAGGGIAAMHAQTALASWSRQEPAMVVGALERRLSRAEASRSRRYVVETIGLVEDRAADRVLEIVATDTREASSVRRTAIAAYADRLGRDLPAAIARMAHRSDDIGSAVRTTLSDRRLARRGPHGGAVTRGSGVRVAQVHLGAEMDADATRAGAGDAGGVATLLARLGGRLARQRHIQEVVTVSRSGPDGPGSGPGMPSGHRFEYVPLERGEGATFTGPWPASVGIARGLRRAFLTNGAPDVVHLRMADPGTLAAATLARRWGIQIVFTVAPDPHGPIDEAETSGSLTRASFAETDASGQLWYRANLVERLAHDADQLVVFPRDDAKRRLRELVGIDLDDGSPRYTVVPEGIDFSLTTRARDVLRSPAAPSPKPVLADLEAAMKALPSARHGLPIVVSVGRLHELKGMARIVEAFGRAETLPRRANLVIVGGDLDDPSAVEAAELARIERLLEDYPRLRDSVVLLGHRPNTDVSLLLAAARWGMPDLVAPAGAYVCGSRKEEFGLALVEALAAGLPVVAPRVGGPATYVMSGVTGTLVDTTDVGALSDGIAQVLDLAARPETAERATATVRDRYTVERMARVLAAIYRVSAGARGFRPPASTGAGAVA